MLNSAFYQRLVETSPTLSQLQVEQAWTTFKFLRQDVAVEIDPEGSVVCTPLSNFGEWFVQNSKLKRKPQPHIPQHHDPSS